MERTAEAMAADADQTNRHSSAVMAAANETAMNVQSGGRRHRGTRRHRQRDRHAGRPDLGRRRRCRREHQSATNARVQALAESASSRRRVALISSIAGADQPARPSTPPSRRPGPARPGAASPSSPQKVKELASQTARATDEITTQINAIQQATRETVGAIAEIGSTIGTVHSIAVGVAAAVEEQQVATQEIAAASATPPAGPSPSPRRWGRSRSPRSRPAPAPRRCSVPPASSFASRRPWPERSTTSSAASGAA